MVKLRETKGAAHEIEKKGWFGRPDRSESAFQVFHINRW